MVIAACNPCDEIQLCEVPVNRGKPGLFKKKEKNNKAAGVQIRLQMTQIFFFVQMKFCWTEIVLLVLQSHSSH